MCREILNRVKKDSCLNENVSFYLIQEFCLAFVVVSTSPCPCLSSPCIAEQVTHNLC